MRNFFGLDDKYAESVYEQFFYLKYHGNWNFQEAYNLPIKIRSWFVHRLAKQIEMENDAAERASRGRG